MSNINKAITQIHRIDDLANRDEWVTKLHPLVWLLVTLWYVVTVVSFSKYDIVGLLAMGVYPIACFVIGNLSFKESLGHLKVVLPIVCVMGIFNPLFDRQQVTYLGIVTTTGMLSMITLILKGVFSVLAAYLLIVNTGIERFCYALRKIHVPQILVTQILLTYRYISVLLAEVGRITDAYSLRAPGQKGIHFKVWGSLAGQLLLRSVDRADAVYESMVLRGFKGEYPSYGERAALHFGDLIWAVVWILLFVLFRKYPVIILAGNLFG